MLELNLDTVRPYLRDRGFACVRSVAELTGGVSNVVFRVETDERVFVLKQSRPQLRTAAPWFSDLSRIYREIDVMQALRPHLGEVVPEVLFRDDVNYAFAMSHAPEPCRDWRSMLLAGEVDPALGAEAGRILGRIHQAMFLNEEAQKRFADRKVFDELRTDPFYRRIRERHPDLSESVDRLIYASTKPSDWFTVCHGDFSPKNLLLHAQGFVLVDYETAHWGNLYFDVGFFLSHILLKAIHRPQQWGSFAELSRSFWKGWCSEIQFKWGYGSAISHTAGCLLARVDGTSPAPYLNDERKRDTARWIARKILRDWRDFGDWEQVLLLAEGECHALTS